MDSDGIDKKPGILGNRVESIQEVSKSRDQIHDYDSLLQTKSLPGKSRGTEDGGDSLPEVPSISLNRAGPDGLKDQSMSMSSASDNKPIDEHSDLCFTPEAKHRRTNLLQSSSVANLSQLRDPSLSPSPHVRRSKRLYFSLYPSTICLRSRNSEDKLKLGIDHLCCFMLSFFVSHFH